MARTALITGVSGQDGAYLSKLLLESGYRVIGQMRPGLSRVPKRLAAFGIEREVEFVELDLLDLAEMRVALERWRPDELYNLAGSSSVAQSFNYPTQPLEVNAVAAARLLEAARLVIPEVRFFQPSSSEMFGEVDSSPQDESTPFRPRSPYAVAKLFSHWQTISYRQAYKFFGVCGILFNHESPLRSRTFVTRKITAELAEIKHGRREPLMLGNLDARRDWGFAGDYVAGIWRALQRPEPDVYVFATGRATSIRRFVELAAESIGIPIEWSGTKSDEVGIDRSTGRRIVAIDPVFFRPAELRETVGDARYAREKLDWAPVVDLPELVAMMVSSDERRLIDNAPMDWD